MIRKGLGLVRVSAWDQLPWLQHGFSTRAGGVSQVYGRADDLNLGFTAQDDRVAVGANRAAVLAELGGQALATMRQVHGDAVLRVDAGGAAGDGDGMITATPGVVLGIQVADCVPVLVADTRLQVVGAFHAGWRGTAAGIAGLGVERMRAEFGCRVEDLVAAVGPSIGPCCYAVGGELRERFAADLFAGDRLDLWEANRRQLVAAGVTEVAVVGECTACTVDDGVRRYFSHRADAGVTGRGMGLIGVVAGS